MPKIKDFDIELLKPGDNILFHTKGFSWVSMAIRGLTESYWNHAARYIREHDTDYVIEALFKGVKKTPLEKYLNPKKYHLKAVRLKREAFVSDIEYLAGIHTGIVNMENKIGDKYDFGAIVFLGVKFIFKSWWKKGFRRLPRLNPFQSREKFFCSEAICNSDYGISSKYPYLYMGKTKHGCGTTTPKDINKSEHVFYVCGIDKL